MSLPSHIKPDWPSSITGCLRYPSDRAQLALVARVVFQFANHFAQAVNEKLALNLLLDMHVPNLLLDGSKTRAQEIVGWALLLQRFATVSSPEHLQRMFVNFLLFICCAEANTHAEDDTAMREALGLAIDTFGKTVESNRAIIEAIVRVWEEQKYLLTENCRRIIASLERFRTLKPEASWVVDVLARLGK